MQIVHQIMKTILFIAAFASTGAMAAAQVPRYDLETNDRGLNGNRQTDYWTGLGREDLGFSSGVVHFGDSPFTNDYLAQNPGGSALIVRRNGETANSAEAGIYAGSGGLISSSMPVAFANLINTGQVTQADVDYYMGQVQFGAWGTPTGQSILAVETDQVFSGLQTIVLQLEIQGHPNLYPNSEGYLTPYEMAHYAYPVTLYLNGSSEGIVADFAEVVWSGPHRGDSGYMPGDEHRAEVFALQWDLSWVNEEITSFSIDFWMMPHTSLTGVRMDQGDVFEHVVAIPEPGAMVLLILTGAAWTVMSRRRELK